MRKSIFISLLITAIILAPFSAVAKEVVLPNKDAHWLEILNYYRASSDLEPVIEDQEMTSGAQNHANYLANTDTKYLVNAFQNLHSENPESPYYTEAGATLGLGNVAWDDVTFSRPIDRLMTAPFHAIGFLREGLTKVGFGTATVKPGGYFPGSQVSDVAIIAGTSGIDQTKNIFFPGPNSTIYLDSFSGENPEPRESCGTNYKAYTGLPIFVSLLTSPSIRTSAVLTTPAGKILSASKDVCVVTEHSFTSSDPIYGAAGRSIIAADHLVLVIPREPLKEGQYGVVIKQSGADDLSWKFTYADAIEKVENTLKVTYPRPNKVLFIGDMVKIKILSLEGEISSYIKGTATCPGRWRGNELLITGKSVGYCTATISGKVSKNTQAFKKSFRFTFIKK